MRIAGALSWTPFEAKTPMSTREVVIGLSSEIGEGVVPVEGDRRALVPSAEGLIAHLVRVALEEAPVEGERRPFGSRVSAAETVIVRGRGLRAPDAGDGAGRVEELLGEALAEVVDALGAEVLRGDARCGPRAGWRRA